MNIWGAVAGGFVGTLVLTTALSTAGELGLTRMDLPFLLGTMLTADRTRAKALGYAMHFIAGQLFALVYFAIFLAIDHSGWWIGAVFGLVHGLFAGIALVNVLLPVIHPRMGTPSSAAADRPAAGTTRIHDAQLRAPHPARNHHRPRCLRHDRRRLHRTRRLNRPDTRFD